MEDPLAILGYQPAPALPGLRAKPPALNYLGSGFQARDQAMSGLHAYGMQGVSQTPAPSLTSTGLPDIEAVERNLAKTYTEQLKAKQAQEQATIAVIQQVSTLNPRSPDYLTQRTKLLQAAPWATQSRDVVNLLGVQEEEHRAQLGQIKELGEFSDKFHQDYRALKKEGKKEEDAVALAMGNALFQKARVEFMEQGAPREVVDRVFKKDGTFDREAMAEWKGEQKRMEFDKKMNGEKGGFIPISQEEGRLILESVEMMGKDPTPQERLDAYNLKHGTKLKTDMSGGAPKEAYEEGWNLAKQNNELGLRKLVNNLALSGKKIPKSLERYVDSEQSVQELDKALEAKLSGSGAATPAANDAIPVVNSPAELKALKLPSGAQFRTPDGRVGRVK